MSPEPQAESWVMTGATFRPDTRPISYKLGLLLGRRWMVVDARIDQQDETANVLDGEIREPVQSRVVTTGVRSFLHRRGARVDSEFWLGFVEGARKYPARS